MIDTQPPVEVVIACHSSTRNLRRAVASVLDGAEGLATVTVVAHNIPASELGDTLRPADRGRVRWRQFDDGTTSPANPYNFGTERAEAKWVSLLGSDDYLAPGAVRAWLELAEGMDAVITRLHHDRGQVVRTPPVRPFPRRPRKAVQDRLYYRSAPLGLMRANFLRQHDLRWDADLNAGGDLRLSGLLWSLGRTAVQSAGPGYVIGSDAADRVTMRLAPLADELAHVGRAWGQEGWARDLSRPERGALATKYLRIHFFGAAYYRATAGQWLPGDRRELCDQIRLVLRRAPEGQKPLSIADRRLLDALVDPAVPDEAVNRLAIARRRFGSPATLVPRNPAYLLHREAPPRFMTASALVR